jgi:hypothetical protein
LKHSDVLSIDVKKGKSTKIISRIYKHKRLKLFKEIKPIYLFNYKGGFNEF